VSVKYEPISIELVSVGTFFIETRCSP